MNRPKFARLPVVTLAALSLVVGPPSQARAQSPTVTPSDPRPSAGWTVTPVFAFSSATDSNVTLAGKDSLNLADKAAGLSPSAEIGYLSPTTTLTAGYSGTAVRYFSLNELNTFDQRLYATVKRMVTKRVQLFGQVSAGWLPTTDTVVLTDVPFVRVGSRIKAGQGGVTFAVAKHTTTTVGYRLEAVDFDQSQPSSQLLGGHTNAVYGDVRQQLSPHLTVGAAYDVRRAIIAHGLQQFTMFNGGGLLEYRFSPALSLSGGVGVATISGSLPGQSSRVGPAWQAGIDYKFERATADATYRRSYVPSYGIGGTSQNEELVAGLRVPVAFRQRLVVSGSLAWRRTDPLDLLRQPLNSFWVSGTAGYAFASWVRVEGFYSRSSQDSHLAGGVVNRQQLGVQVVTLAPMRFK